MKLSSESGFSLLELLIVVLLIGIVSSFAIINLRNSSKTVNVAGEGRILSSHLEEVRINAIRRHASASVQLNSSTSYIVTADFGGNGSPSSMTYNLPPGMSLSYTLPPATASTNPSTTPLTIAYDWRGRTTNAVVITVSSNFANTTPTTLAVGAGGDISNETTVTAPASAPTPQNTSVSPTTSIKNMTGTY